nr:ATPase domain containing protein [Haemonchus contortus]
MSAETRRRPNILITGTPGTGKSTLAQEVASRLQFDAIDVGKEVREHGLVEDFDPRLNCHVLDEEKLLDHMEDRMNSDAGGVVVDYHGVDFFPERWFDIVVVLRCSNTLLYDRLAQRGYDPTKIKENIECEIFGSLLEEARDSYKQEIIHELQSETVDQMHANIDYICRLAASTLAYRQMCQMWQRIRYGVRWKPAERFALAARALDLKRVKSVDISLDPFHSGNESIRRFWHSIMSPKVRLTNPTLKVSAEVRNDRQPPFFIATLDNGKKLHFKTDNMPATDLIMRFNKLLGNPELGKSGTRPRPNA